MQLDSPKRPVLGTWLLFVRFFSRLRGSFTNFRAFAEESAAQTHLFDLMYVSDLQTSTKLRERKGREDTARWTEVKF